MANMLAAHMELENPIIAQWCRMFWNSPRIASTCG